MSEKGREVAYISDKAERLKVFEELTADLCQEASEFSTLYGCKVYLEIQTEVAGDFKFICDGAHASNEHDSQQQPVQTEIFSVDAQASMEEAEDSNPATNDAPVCPNDNGSQQDPAQNISPKSPC